MSVNEQAYQLGVRCIAAGFELLMVEAKEEPTFIIFFGTIS